MMKRTKYTDSFNEVFGNDQSNFVPFNISGINSFNLIVFVYFPGIKIVKMSSTF